jgi:hypothetical protein|tara:strand:+ start:494 stop:709 length:216 start_codon:yes stop_codon:yes gene_type:complete
MKIEQHVEIKYNWSYCTYNGLEIEDADSNKILIRMSDDQVIDLTEKLNAKVEYINEKRKDKVEEQNAEADS